MAGIICLILWPVWLIIEHVSSCTCNVYYPTLYTSLHLTTVIARCIVTTEESMKIQKPGLVTNVHFYHPSHVTKLRGHHHPRAHPILSGSYNVPRVTPTSTSSTLQGNIDVFQIYILWWNVQQFRHRRWPNATAPFCFDLIFLFILDQRQNQSLDQSRTLKWK